MLQLQTFLVCLFLWVASMDAAPSYSVRLPGANLYDSDSWEEESGWFGAGREYSLFDSRGGDTSSNDHMPTSNDNNGNSNGNNRSPADQLSEQDAFLERYRRSRIAKDRYGSSARRRGTRRRVHGNSPLGYLYKTQDWWASQVSPNLDKLPKIVCRVEPTTTLKLRKTFRPLKTIVRLGAEFNTQLGVWQFQSSWEDAIIGGKLTLAGKELQLSKSWQLSVGAVEDLVTRLRFRAAINLETFQAYARVGFRTERLSPINVMEGFTILKRIPLDGSRNNVKLEVKANVALPEPEIEYSTESQRKTMIGMGDVEVSIDELNLLLDY